MGEEHSEAGISSSMVLRLKEWLNKGKPQKNEEGVDEVGVEGGIGPNVITLLLS